MHQLTDVSQNHGNLQETKYITGKAIAEAQHTVSKNLAKILETSKLLQKLSSQEIKFLEPIITLNEFPLIFPRSLTVIQGATGSHKSRLTEAIGSLLLAMIQKNEIGFERAENEPKHVIVMIDTERTLQDQLPYAIQKFKQRAGYAITDDPTLFEYISLLQIPRNERFSAVQEYLAYIKRKHQLPLFVILDVITDCVEDFNRVDCTMVLIDEINLYINDYDTTFLCVIHENPGSDKARGHLGTEISNKATTILKIGLENNGSQETDDIIKIQTLKVRNGRKPEPIYLRYDEVNSCLANINESELSKIRDNDKKASVGEIVTLLERNFSLTKTEMTKTELYGIISNKFGVGNRTIDQRIREIQSLETSLTIEDGCKRKLYKVQEGRTVYFKLINLNEENPL